MAEVHDDILMYEYKHKDVTDVADVADFEEIAPKIGTVILADARQLIFMSFC
jgi:hypothetical protein